LTDPTGATTIDGYKLAGNQQTVIDPLGRVASYLYDVDNQLIRLGGAVGLGRDPVELANHSPAAWRTRWAFRAPTS
jgi:uncharacterized protein RhaS with RHS repeats